MPSMNSKNRRNAAMSAAPLSQIDPVDDQSETIDLSEYFKLIKKHIWMLIVLTLGCGVLAGVLTWALVPPTYASSGTIFLTPKVEGGEVDYTSLNSNQKLVNNVMNLLTQDNILTSVAQENGLENASQVKDMLTIENTANTEIIRITCVSKDAKLSKDIVTDVIDKFIDTMSESLNVQNIQITDKPKLSYVPVGPSIKKNAVIGAAAGLVLGLAILLIRMLTDKRLKTREEAESYLGLPVYAELPDLEK